MPSSNFSDYVSGFKSGWGALAAAAAAGPVVLFLTDLAPPWPNESGAAAGALGTFSTISGLLFAYLDGGSGKRWRRRAILSVGSAVAFALLYIACWSVTVVEVPQRTAESDVLRRFVIGFAEHPEGLSPADAIRTYGPDEAYPRMSLLAGRVSLLASWMAIFLSLSYGFGLLQLAQQRRMKARPPAA